MIPLHLTILLLIALPLTALAQRGPLWETSWRNPEFIKKFTGSYGFDGPREPTITQQEQILFREVATLIEQNNLGAATMRIQQSITPQSSAALDYTLGNLYFQSGQLNAAENAYRTALQKFPGFVRAQKNLGLVLMQAGRYGEARPFLVATIEGNGADGSTYAMLAYTHFNDERYKSALQGYEQALLHEPDNTEWQIGRAQALYATEQTDEAAAAFEELLAKYPGREDLWLMQANAWLILDQPARAAANIEVVRRMGKTDAASLKLLGDIYLTDNMPTLATSAYLEALEQPRPPTAAQALEALALLIDRGAWESAGQLQKALESRYQGQFNPEQATRLLNFNAQIAMAQGDSDGAARTLRALLNREPMNGQALLLLAQYEADRGEREEAELLYERAVRVPQYAARAYVEHARMLVFYQDYAEAAKLLRKAQQIDPRETIQRYLESVERARRSVGRM